MNVLVRVKDRNINTGNISLAKDVIDGHSNGVVTGLTVAEGDSIKESYYGGDLHLLLKNARSMGKYYLAKRRVK